MPQIFTTTYEVMGAGLELASAHYAEIDSARAAQWAFVELVGGSGMRPGHNGGLHSVYFKELPVGWRKIGRSEGLIEAVPHKGSAAGKALAKQIAEIPNAPRGGSLASALGFNPSSMAIDERRGTISFPTETRLELPKPRFFVRLPRFKDDGFEPDEQILRAIPESEFMKALEDHNEKVRLLKQDKAA